MGPLPRMHQVVLLQVGQLGEVLLAQATLERALPTVHTQMDLSQVWEKGCQLPRSLQQVLSKSLPTSPQDPYLASSFLSALATLSLPSWPLFHFFRMLLLFLVPCGLGGDSDQKAR